MDFKTLKIHKEGPVLVGRLNRPDKRNALSLELLEELLGLFRAVDASDDFRVFVLRGEGKVFSAGADISMMAGVEGKTQEDLRREAGLFYDCFDALHRLKIPTICYAHGGVHGGANGLLAASDIVLCESECRFSFGEVRLGLIPATVAPFVVRRTGIARARKMMLGGHVFGSGEALEAGLADYLCPPNEADARLAELIDHILCSAPGALQETKRFLLQMTDPADAEGMRDLCVGLIARARMSEEAREGIQAFFSKRDPGWWTRYRGTL